MNKRALIACEYSGIVRDAFTAQGWDAISCDILPTESPGKHYQGNVFDIINDGFKLMICFPPCTYLTVAANRHFIKNPHRWSQRLNAVNFAWELFNADIEHIAMENPIGALSTHIGPPNQIIDPYYFGDPIPKKTCLWLKNLPPLEYNMEETLFGKKTAVDPEYILYNCKKNKSGKSKYSIFGKLGKGKGKERSKFHIGIAQAMAVQWTEHITSHSGVARVE